MKNLYLKLTTCLIFGLFVFQISQGQDNRQRKLLIIGIDGCRPEGIDAANTPNIDAIAANGQKTYHSYCQFPTWSATGWSSMLTGTWSHKHQAKENFFIGNQLSTYKHLFSHINDVNPSLVTASIVDWSPINNTIVKHADIKITTSSDDRVRDRSVETLTNEDVDILFSYFVSVDDNGHATGFSANNPNYINAVEVVDGYVGDIMTALNNRPNIVNENWLIFVSTDHGGLSRGGYIDGHGANSWGEKNTFMIISGDSIPNEVIELDSIDRTTVATPQFSGAGESANLGGSTDLRFGSNQDFTIDFHVKAESGNTTLLSNKADTDISNKGWMFQQKQNGDWQFQMSDGTRRKLLAGGKIDDGKWHHIGISVNRTEKVLRLFHDGTMYQQDFIKNIGDIQNNLDVLLGRDHLQSSDNFTGEISDIRFWTKAMDEFEIGAIVNKEITSAHPDYSDLVAHFPLNEGSGTTLVDATGNIASAALSAPNWNTSVGNIRLANYTNQPRIVDIAPTALTHLCIPTNESWEIDGRNIGAACIEGIPSAVFQNENTSIISVYPNPSSAFVRLDFPEKLRTDVTLEVFNVQGVRMMSKSYSYNQGSAEIVTKDFPNGEYLIQLSAGDDLYTASFVQIK